MTTNKPTLVDDKLKCGHCESTNFNIRVSPNGEDIIGECASYQQAQLYVSDGHGVMVKEAKLKLKVPADEVIFMNCLIDVDTTHLVGFNGRSDGNVVRTVGGAK